MQQLLIRLYPLCLFGIGFVSGTQFALQNYPILLIMGFAFFYQALTRAKHCINTSLVYAFSFGYGFFSYSHSWISHPLTAFGNLYTSIQPLVFVVVPAVLAMYFLVIGWANWYLQIPGTRCTFALSIITVLVEYLRCEYAPAVPLGQVGSVWLSVTSMAQNASIFGVYGLSLITIFFSYALGELWQNWRSILLSGGILVAFFVLGSWRITTTPLQVGNDTVRIVPTAWKQVEKYGSVENRAAHLSYLVQQSVGDHKVVNLILWPETTIEFSLLQHDLGYDFIYPEIKPYLQGMISQETVLLAGVVLRTKTNKAYNAVFGMSNEGLSYIYKKRFLAPFGEFMPSGLRRITNLLGIHAMDDFSCGDANQPLLTLRSGIIVKPIICYEASFSQQLLSRHQSIDLMAVSTNDAWFRYNGKEQQFISHAFRSIENGIPMVRSANKGFSGYVSPIGTYVVSLSDRLIDVKPHLPLSMTPYRWITSTFSYWVELFLGLFLLMIGIMERMFRKNQNAS